MLKKPRKYQKKTFMQSVIILMFSQLIIKIVGLIYKLYLTNKYGFGDEGNAIYSSGYQIYALLLTLSSIGVPNAISKLVSAKIAIGDNKGAYRIFKIAIAIFGFIGFSGSLLLFLGAHKIANYYLQIPEAELSIMAIAPSVFLVSITSILRGYFNGKENISATANSQSLEQILKTILTIIIVELIGVISKNNTMFMAAGATIATTLATFFSLFYLFMYYKFGKKYIWQEINLSKIYKKERIKKIIKNILIVSIPISLSALLSTMNKTVDALTIVRQLKDLIGEKEATIQYGILSGKIDTLITLPFSFNIAFATTLVPAISSAIAKKEFLMVNKRIEFSILITILIGLPCAICMCIFAKPILGILFPKASSGSSMLQLSSFTILFIVLIQTINGSLQGLGNTKIPVIALGIGTIIKLILNIILIPIKCIGINGAIISSIICDMISFIIVFSSLKRETNIKFKLLKFLIKPIIATIFMSICSLWIYNKLFILLNIKALILSLLFGGIIYILVILLLKILSKDELFMIPYGKKIYNILKKVRIYG